MGEVLSQELWLLEGQQTTLSPGSTTSQAESKVPCPQPAPRAGRIAEHPVPRQHHAQVGWQSTLSPGSTTSR